MFDLERVKQRIKISFVIPAWNEGNYLRETLQSYQSDCPDAEYVIVDGGCEDGCCENLPGENVRVIREDAEARGTGHARNLGAFHSNGDVVIFSDAHMQIAQGSLREAAAAAWMFGAIVAPAVRPLEGQTDWVRCSGDLAIGEDAGLPALRINYNGWSPDFPPYVPVTALIGACYVIPRFVLERVGYWCDTPGWGFSDHSMSLKAFFCGIPILSARDVQVRHKYRRHASDRHKRIPRECGGKPRMWANRVWVTRVIFDDATFNTVWSPIFSCHSQWENLKGELERPEVARERLDFQARKVRSDDEFRDIILGGEWPRPPSTPSLSRAAKPERTLGRWPEAFAAAVMKLRPEHVLIHQGYETGVAEMLATAGVQVTLVPLEPKAPAPRADLLLLLDSLECIPRNRLGATLENLRSAPKAVFVSRDVTRDWSRARMKWGGEAREEEAMPFGSALFGWAEARVVEVWTHERHFQY